MFIALIVEGIDTTTKIVYCKDNRQYKKVGMIWKTKLWKNQKHFLIQT